MDCPECDRLTAEHERSKRLYANAVELLFATGWQVADAEHAGLKKSVEEARIRLEVAELRLAQRKRATHIRSGSTAPCWRDSATHSTRAAFWPGRVLRIRTHVTAEVCGVKAQAGGFADWRPPAGGPGERRTILSGRYKGGAGTP